MNRIFHPNIDEMSGTVCLDVINQTWSPMFGKETFSHTPFLSSLALDMINIFEVFLPQLLRYPNPADPLNGEAASMMMRDMKGYESKVREYVRRYAGPESFEAGMKGETESELSSIEEFSQDDADDMEL